MWIDDVIYDGLKQWVGKNSLHSSIPSSLVLHVNKASCCLSHVWSRGILSFAQGPVRQGQAPNGGEWEWVMECGEPGRLESTGYPLPWSWVITTARSAHISTVYFREAARLSGDINVFTKRHSLKRCSSPHWKEGTYSDTYAWYYLELNLKNQCNLCLG